MRSARAALLALFACLAVGCSNPRSKDDVHAEDERRAAFARKAALEGDAGSALLVASRPDVLFEEGFSIVTFDLVRNAGFRWMGQRGHVRLKAHEGRPMLLKLTGWTNESVIRSKPIVAVYLNGQRILDTGPVEMGHWGGEVVVPGEILQGSSWRDLIITVSAVAFHWADPPALQVVVLNSLEWTESP
jgi:hypothetical protein